MNVENPIDELFRRKLGQSEATVPDDMWSRIAAARQPEETPRRTYRPYWLWGGLALTSVLGLGLWLMLRPATPEVTLGAFPLEESRLSPPSASTTAAVALPLAIDKAEVSQATSTSTLASQAQALDKNTTQSASASTLQPAQAVVPSSSVTLIMDGDAAQATAQGASLLVPPVEEVPEDILPAITAEEQATIPNFVVTESSAAPQEVVDENDRIFGPHRRRQTVVVNTLPTENFQQKPVDLSDYLLFAKHAPQCAKFARNFLRFDLEVLGGPAYAHQQLEAKSSESLDHLSRRQASETSSLSYSGGLRLSAISRSGLGLRMGLNYNQINDHFHYPTMKVNFVEGPTGEYIPVDTLYQTMKVDNRLRMVEIPLLVTYETKWKQLRVGFNLGAALNLWFDAKGELYSPVSDQPIAFGQVGDREVLPIFETQASAALLGSMTFAYNLHRRWSVVAEPYFRTHPRAFSNPAYDLTQNYWQTGVQLGLRMRL